MRITRVGPIVTPESHPEAGTNINGPSLIRVPSWATGIDGQFALFFADHKGSSIRLAVADEVTGPYRWVPGGSLSLADSGFPTEVPRGIEPSNEIQRAAIEAEGYDEHFTPHIASPDVIVDDDRRCLWMAYHGLCDDGSQLTRIARSDDGARWTAGADLIGFPYLRILPARLPSTGDHLGLSMPGILYRSSDMTAWESGPMLFDLAFRHCAIARRGSTLHVLWSRVGDEPERLLHSTVDMTDLDWTHWTRIDHGEILRPEHEWEGADLPVESSARGQVTTRVHQLRDPAIFEDGDQTWLLYSIAGESGIALARIDSF